MFVSIHHIGSIVQSSILFFTLNYLFFIFYFLFLLASNIKLLQLNDFNKVLKIKYIIVTLRKTDIIISEYNIISN
jgi:hypothetical protein